MKLIFFLHNYLFSRIKNEKKTSFYFFSLFFLTNFLVNIKKTRKTIKKTIFFYMFSLFSLAFFYFLSTKFET